MAAIMSASPKGLANAPEALDASDERSRDVQGVEFLPLTPAANALGSYWLGLKRLPPSEQVGRFSVSCAAEVSAERIALLALDPSLSDLHLERALYLDTETTGLSGSGAYAFLVGLGFFVDGQLQVEQLFIADPTQEAAAIEHLRQRVEECQLLVSFNGKSFDWPLLKGRCVMNRLPALPERPHLDLLHLARRVHKERKNRCKLTSLECDVLGFERIGDIDGAEVCSRYLHYLRSGDATALDVVLQHNHWDVISMAALVAVYAQDQPDLTAQDFIGIAQTLKRARSLTQAREAADIAIVAGAGTQAHAARAEIQKALGDRLASLRDYEAAHQSGSSPKVRLELAKLYEHYAKQPGRALALLEQGTSEGPAAAERRQARLQRKLGE
jgi:uncharacterized protein YprB with RNaseH-like and TPR domain